MHIRLVGSPPWGGVNSWPECEIRLYQANLNFQISGFWNKKEITTVKDLFDPCNECAQGHLAIISNHISEVYYVGCKLCRTRRIESNSLVDTHTKINSRLVCSEAHLSLHLAAGPLLHLATGPSLHLATGPLLHLASGSSLHLATGPSLHLATGHCYPWQQAIATLGNRPFLCLATGHC